MAASGGRRIGPPGGAERGSRAKGERPPVHEFVSRNIENTGDPVVTQRLARHKDGRTTQGYMHARESRVMAAVVRLNQ